MPGGIGNRAGTADGGKIVFDRPQFLKGAEASALQFHLHVCNILLVLKSINNRLVFVGGGKTPARQSLYILLISKPDFGLARSAINLDLERRLHFVISLLSRSSASWFPSPCLALITETPTTGGYAWSAFILGSTYSITSNNK